MQDINFITTNKHKVKEAQAILSSFGINTKPINYDYAEIQSSDLRDIALDGARSSFEKFKVPLIVDDSGLFITGLNGFPGPFSSYVFKTIGNRGILKLLGSNRDAIFQTVVVYKDSETEKTFLGEVKGKIAAVSM